MSGLELSRSFFAEVVAPLLERVAPGVRYTAGRFGARSDAFGFDDEVSRDHWWGPGCQLLLDPAAFDGVAQMLDEVFRTELPASFRGHSTLGVEMSTPQRYLSNHLGVARADDLTVVDWLTFTDQSLLEVTSGELFRDDLQFARTREQLRCYPDDLRLYLMAVQWSRILDEQAFPGRAGSREDEAGSAIVLARLTESAMRLCFYLERRYAPYGKWFGTAFRRLDTGAGIVATIDRMLAAPGWQERDRLWESVLRHLIAAHEQAGVLAAGKYRPAPVYLGRPGSGLPQFDRGDSPALPQLIEDIRSRISDPAVLALPARLGSLDQFFALRDAEEGLHHWRAMFRALLGSGLPPSQPVQHPPEVS